MAPLALAHACTRTNMAWHHSQVDGAGHMVPLDQPSNAYSAIEQLVADYSGQQSSD